MRLEFFVLRHSFRKYLCNRYFLEKYNAENLQNFAHTQLDFEFFLDNGYQNVNADGNPDLGLHGMNKNVFAEDFSAIDREIERLKPLVGYGGYIPCPDHRIAPDAKWDNVCYYCDRVRKVFGG